MYIRWKNEWTTPALVGVGSFLAGAGVGALAYRFKVDRDIQRGLTAMQDAVDEDVKVTWAPSSKDVVIIDETVTTTTETEIPIEDIPQYVRQALLVDQKTPDDIEEDLAAIFKRKMAEGPTQVKVHTEEATAPTRNVFEEIEWDAEAEEGSRDPARPYVIHEDDFFNHESGFPQTNLTWYEGDNIMADENMVIVYDPEKILGPLMWGHGTRDQDGVYIRHEKNRAEYFVQRVPGSYEHAAYGAQAEAEGEAEDLRHSQRIPKFRIRD